MYVYVYLYIHIYRQQDLLHVARRSLHYMLMLESVYMLASPVVQALQELIQLMNSAIEEEEVCRSGRPRIVIREEQLRFLIENDFHIADIARLFQCSRRTIERRMAELSLRSCDFTVISDADLDQRVEGILSLHPQCGEKTVSGHLRSQGFKVQRQRI